MHFFYVTKKVVLGFCNNKKREKTLKFATASDEGDEK